MAAEENTTEEHPAKGNGEMKDDESHSVTDDSGRGVADPAEPQQESGHELDVENTEAVKEELERLRMQAGENLDRALRAQAELDNIRKRTSRDIENAHKYALEKFINELLPVVDSIELGISATETAENSDSLREGLDLTLKMFLDCLQKFGVTTHNPIGEKFNPEFHEAVSVLEQDGIESGAVISVMQKGYDLNGRLIRPAMVVVAK